ncbi:MAG: glycosyltransferase family 1 protein [Eubacteriales bacterium]|nr:glycosyltransferase family 1 protein [Eubacteriales bacterium]
MNILFDHQIFFEQRIGGVSRYHIELARSLEQVCADHVDIPVPIVLNAYLADYTHRKLRTSVPDSLSRRLYQLTTLALDWKLRREQYDIVHLTWYKPRVLQACRGQKTVITIHDMVQEIFGIDPVTVERKKYAAHQADGIIAISESTKRDILKFYPDIPEDKIKVIYHGTNHLGQAVRPSSFPVPEKYLLFVGRRDGYKNAAFLMENLASLLKERTDLHLVFAGGGAFTQQEETLLGQLEIRDRVLQETVSDGELAWLYQNAVCFLYPSKYEGFGFPILEAFDNRCPVLCSNASCLPEVGGDAVLYFSPEDGGELRDRVNAIISDGELRRQYIQRGAERVKLFTWEETARKTSTFYKKIAGQE